MAKPTKGATRSKTNSRRSHHSLKATASAVCASCGTAIRPHRACTSCGTYKNRKVTNTSRKSK